MGKKETEKFNERERILRFLKKHICLPPNFTINSNFYANIASNSFPANRETSDLM